MDKKQLIEDYAEAVRAKRKLQIDNVLSIPSIRNKMKTLTKLNQKIDNIETIFNMYFPDTNLEKIKNAAIITAYD